jgi:hypothetical protein
VGTTTKKRLPVVEVLSKANEGINKPVPGLNENPLDLVGNGMDAVKVFAGKNAFRIYNAATGEIGKNSIGTLQGMVKSADARAVFRVVGEVGEKFEIVAFLAGLADNLQKTSSEFEAVWQSNDSAVAKAANFNRLARAVAARTAIGIVTSGVGTIYDALKGWCMIGGLAGGKMELAAKQCVDVLEDAKLGVDKVGNELADLSADPTMYVIEIRLGQRTFLQPSVLPARR